MKDITVMERAKKLTESLATQTDRQSIIEQSTQRSIETTRDPIKITWTDLNYSIPIKTSQEEQKEGKGKTKLLKVLNNCTGYALPGQTLFIMGASGAGKTSLMNVLANRVFMVPGALLEG